MTLLSDTPLDRVMVFIDYRNVIVAVQNSLGNAFPLDFYRLAQTLAGARRLVGAYVFDSEIPSKQDDLTHQIHERLEYLGFRLITSELDTDVNQQKEVDVAMACEMLDQAFHDSYDVAIVVSGDRDFIPAIKHVQAYGKRVEVASYDSAFAKKMIRMCDAFHKLDYLPILELRTNTLAPSFQEAVLKSDVEAAEPPAKEAGA